MEELLNWMEYIEDVRQARKVRHKLKDILVIVLFATLANADDWVEMELFAKEYQDFLRKYIELKNGIPSHDTLNRVASSTFFALLFKFYHLLGQILIALGHLAIRVMGKNAFALGADLLCSDGMGNLSAEYLDFAAVGLPQQSSDLLGKVGTVVHHRQQDTVNLELGIDLPLHLIYGLE